MTIGTRLFTWLRGEKVGTDPYGNTYYRERGRPKRAVGGLAVERRWVIYKGEPEPTKVPALWHAWLHHTIDDPPVEPRKRYPWERDHVPNRTGTPEAYRPKGHPLVGGAPAAASGDYEPWRPD